MKAFKRIVVALILLGGVTAIAQPDPATNAPPAAAPSPATTATAPARSLSVPEIRSRAESVLASIRGDYRYVLTLRDRVRKQKDVIKLDCVNDRLVQMKAQMNIADKSNEQLQGTLERDLAASNEQLVTLEGNGRSIAHLREQANACVGESELSKQEAGLEVTKPDIPDDPGTIDPYLPDGNVIEPPGYASAFQ